MHPVISLSVFPFTIYINLGFEVHLKDFFSETTASTNLRFHMQHDQNAGLQTCKSQPGQESKMAADTKDSKTVKINFFSRTELSHNDCLKVYVDPGF